MQARCLVVLDQKGNGYVTMSGGVAGGAQGVFFFSLLLLNVHLRNQHLDLAITLSYCLLSLEELNRIALVVPDTRVYLLIRRG